MTSAVAAPTAASWTMSSIAFGLRSWGGQRVGDAVRVEHDRVAGEQFRGDRRRAQGEESTEKRARLTERLAPAVGAMHDWQRMAAGHDVESESGRRANKHAEERGAKGLLLRAFHCFIELAEYIVGIGAVPRGGSYGVTRRAQ